MWHFRTPFCYFFFFFFFFQDQESDSGGRERGVGEKVGDQDDDITDDSDD